jgi:signal transduction histidine kinase
MASSSDGPLLRGSADTRLLAYVADLEVEVDRLRRHNRLMYQEARAVVDRVRPLCDELPKSREIETAVVDFAAALDDLRELPGYHPALDQVVAVAFRPLAEQVFRWQRRLQNAEGAELRLELDVEYVEWFPARLRHILDNLVSNALRYRDANKAETWVRIGLRATPEAYELRISDNGLGMPVDERRHLFELLYRAALARGAGVGVGLAIVKLLVEKSGGKLTVDSGAGQGTTFVASLPRYEVDDHLE